MNKITDLRLIGLPTMTLVLPDNEGTTVHITAPSVDLVERLNRSKTLLNATLRGELGDEKLRLAVYDLAADLINCNEDDFNTTPKELATRYRVSLRGLQVFFDDYRDFLKAIENEKN